LLIIITTFIIEKGLAEAFPESGLQIGLWLNADKGCRDIMSGLLHENMYRLFDFIQSDLPESLPKVFLRVGYEFDNPSFGYDNPSLYQDAFRKLVRTCEDQMTYNVCHEKIAFVWHSWAAPRQTINTSLDQFYPGDDFVDWVGVSIFQQLYPWANNNNNDDNEHSSSSGFAGGNILEVEEVLDFAKSRKKPIMIAESTPFGGMDVLESNNIPKGYPNINNSSSSSSSSSSNDIWNIWFQKTIDIIDKFDIAMWSYINCDWDSQPMWKGIGFGDTRLSSSEDVMNHWWDQILNNDNNNDNSTNRFLFRIENCDDGELYDPTITVIETDGGAKNNRGDSIYSQGIQHAVPSSSLLSKLVVGTSSMPTSNNWRTSSFTSLLSGKFFCLLPVGVLVVMLLVRLVHKTKQQRYRVERRSQPAYDTCIIHPNNSNNDSQRTYGSFEMKISKLPKKLSSDNTE